MRFNRWRQRAFGHIYSALRAQSQLLARLVARTLYLPFRANWAFNKLKQAALFLRWPRRFEVGVEARTVCVWPWAAIDRLWAFLKHSYFRHAKKLLILICCRVLSWDVYTLANLMVCEESVVHLMMLLLIIWCHVNGLLRLIIIESVLSKRQRQ